MSDPISIPPSIESASDLDASMPSRTWFVVPALVGGAIAVALGSYGKLHTPTGLGIHSFGFPAVLPMKAWFTTIAASLGLIQVLSALVLYGKLPGGRLASTAVPTIHRWSGTIAFLFTLPVAYHCLWALGYQTTTTRVAIHSFLGCLFYGMFATKMLTLRSKQAPSWALPMVGGALFTILVGLWWTSSLWFFTTIGFPGI